MRPLAPKSEALYRRLLTRAFGAPELTGVDALRPEVATWPAQETDILRAAIARTAGAQGLDPTPILNRIPRKYRIARKPIIPDEDAALKYERAARELPKGHRALALLPLALGLRAEEVCELRREDVARAIRAGILTFVRKGGREHSLDVLKSKDLLRDLLTAPAALPHGRLLHPLTPRAPWTVAGEVMSRASPRARYQALWRLVRRVARAAGLEQLPSPHKLRHVFATRMGRDGANLREIQEALNHSQITTTARYVHPDPQTVSKTFRQF